MAVDKESNEPFIENMTHLYTEMCRKLAEAIPTFGDKERYGKHPSDFDYLLRLVRERAGTDHRRATPPAEKSPWGLGPQAVIVDEEVKEYTWIVMFTGELMGDVRFDASNYDVFEDTGDIQFYDKIGDIVAMFPHATVRSILRVPEPVVDAPVMDVPVDTAVDDAQPATTQMNTCQSCDQPGCPGEISPGVPYPIATAAGTYQVGDVHRAFREMRTQLVDAMGMHSDLHTGALPLWADLLARVRHVTQKTVGPFKD